MTAMAASSLPSLEAEEDWGECLLAFAAPCKICSDKDVAVLAPAVAPEPVEALLIPPRDVDAAVVAQVTGVLLKFSIYEGFDFKNSLFDVSREYVFNRESLFYSEHFENF